MKVAIDTRNPLPVFAQLVAQIKSAVLAGTLMPGAALPTIRQLANDLQLNNNTVAKAYRTLERDSVIETRGRRGTFVHPDAKENSLVDLNEIAIALLKRSIGELRESGLTDSEIRKAFGEVMNDKATLNREVQS